MRGSMHANAGWVLAAVLSLQSHALAQPNFAVSYFDSALSFNACMQRAQSVLQAYGTTDVQRLPTAISASYGDYTLAIFCITNKSLVMALGAGPDAKTANNHVNSIVPKLTGQ